MSDEETPKVSKTEEKESFLKRLEEKTSELKKIEENIRVLTERNEELAARKLLGGKSDAGEQPTLPVEETPKEYLKRMTGIVVKSKHG